MIAAVLFVIIHKTSTMYFKNKTVFITGGSRGIGKSIAVRLAKEGANVAIAAKTVEPNPKLEGTIFSAAEEIAKAGSGKVLPLQVDIRYEESINEAVKAAAEAFGGIDILVSNAGIQIVNSIENYSFGDWKKMLAIHLDGAFLTTRAALKYMYRPGHGGTVIYMGSVHSHEASPLKSAYVTAKHGLLGLARVLAKEGAAHNVRAHVICPGFVRTPLVDKQIPEQAKELGMSEEDVVRRVMLGGTVDGIFTTVEDVAETALFLCAFPSAALTGQSVLVSHGWCMQ